MRNSIKNSGSEESDIDITPMLDVVFIMLISPIAGRKLKCS